MAQIKISAQTEQLLREAYNNGVGVRTLANQLSKQFSEESGVKTTITMDNVRTLWTQMKLNPAEQPKPKKIVSFVFETSELNQPDQVVETDNADNGFIGLTEPLEEAEEVETVSPAINW